MVLSRSTLNVLFKFAIIRACGHDEVFAFLLLSSYIYTRVYYYAVVLFYMPSYTCLWSIYMLVILFPFCVTCLSGTKPLYVV